jgi:hypothetical protein
VGHGIGQVEAVHVGFLDPLLQDVGHGGRRADEDGPRPPMPPQRASSSMVQALSPLARCSTTETMALVSTLRTRSVGAYWPKSMPLQPDMNTSAPS